MTETYNLTCKICYKTWNSEVPFYADFEHYHLSELDEFLEADAERGRELHGDKLIATGEEIMSEELTARDVEHLIPHMIKHPSMLDSFKKVLEPGEYRLLSKWVKRAQ